jgi:lipoprotein-anchoring transpeptidase ErfK/SrfK
MLKIPISPARSRLAVLGLALFLAVSPRLLPAESAAGEAKGVDWLKPSGGPYPRLREGEPLWIRVSLRSQKVDIMDGNRSIYTMLASSGLDDPADDRTPEGTYSIQRERGLSFYSPKAGEGARYWVSWLHHGEYLFHSVPTDKAGNIIEEEARKLGSKASHGCIRLALPDAKWIYENIRYGAKVVIGP